MLVVKAGNEFIAYLLDLTQGTSGIWTTQGLVNDKGKLRDVSHLTLYTTPAVVPVPAAGFLLIGALGGLAPCVGVAPPDCLSEKEMTNRSFVSTFRFRT